MSSSNRRGTSSIPPSKSSGRYFLLQKIMKKNTLLSKNLKYKLWKENSSLNHICKCPKNDIICLFFIYVPPGLTSWRPSKGAGPSSSTWGTLTPSLTTLWPQSPSSWSPAPALFPEINVSGTTLINIYHNISQYISTIFITTHIECTPYS